MATRLFASGVDLDGLDLSGVDDRGVDITLNKIDGWAGSPASTLTVTQRAGDHGGWSSSNPRFKSRVLTLAGTVTADDPALVRDTVDLLNDAAALDPVKLTVTESGRDRWCMVQRQDDVLIDDTIAHAVTFSMQLVAVDPRKYGDTIVQSTHLPTVSGGLTWPLTWPVRWDGVATSGVISIDNPGNIASPVKLRIDGPIDGPRVTHLASGKTLMFSTSLALAAGDWLDVDMARREVLANGQVSRNTWVVDRGFFDLDPGVNEIAFGASGAYNPNAQLTVTVTPAWK